MIVYRKLLAKGWDKAKDPVAPEVITLTSHAKSAEKAADAVVSTYGKAMLANLGLPRRKWLPLLSRAVRVACRLHDIGKGTDVFQAMLRNASETDGQPVRHEIIAYMVLRDMRAWLLKRFSGLPRGVADSLCDVVIGAVVGHHIKVDLYWEKCAPALSKGLGRHIVYYGQHPDMLQLMPKSPASEFLKISCAQGAMGDAFNRFRSDSALWKQFLDKNRDWYLFAGAVKALTVACDVAASTLIPAGENLPRWVTGSLARTFESWHAERVVARRLNGFPPRQFQQRMGDSAARITLVEAGCGSGKTVGAYLWAGRNARKRKLFFCYPTTGSATEGFLGYVAADEIEARLLHSRSNVDLDMADKQHAGDDHLAEKLFSLSRWGARVSICTADSVLALMRNNRSGLFNAPAILGGAFIFDELHAYDDQMFSALVGLMRALPRAKFLLMSATLSAKRKEILRREFRGIADIEKPEGLEDIKRYLFVRKLEGGHVLRQVRRLVASGKKVLWICNTVGRAQERYREALDMGDKVALYHSRYKYVHKVARHREVVDSFDGRRRQGGFLAITTQVAEMSLDLDADLLITEDAAMASLIQRLGRLNRGVSVENPGSPREAWFLKPKKSVPYETEEIRLAGKWIEALARKGSPLSQKDLHEEFMRINTVDEELPQGDRMELYDYGWFSFPGNVREASVCVPVIMEEDLPACRNSFRALINNSFSLNFQEWRGMGNWQIFKGYYVAPAHALTYCEKVGAEWG